MTISWYPGHMHKARKELQKLMSSVHVTIEVLDARTPYASSNPVLTAIRGDTPCIKILNKSDLAIAEVTAAWQHYFNQQERVICLRNGLEEPLSLDRVLTAAGRLLQTSEKSQTGAKQLVIAGIPNVGKSTLLNQFAQRKLAKTGNEPAITRSQQRIKLADGWYLIDTPGLLWPRLEDQQAAARLACTGTIRNTAVAAADIAWFAAELLLKDYRAALETRYGIDSGIVNPEELLDFIGKKRGSLGRGGAPDLQKTAELLLNDFRSGKLGRFSLESPPG
ncbi:MAG: ribosome biogenesis GTPase YlqF [Gammaproteobacteria bacterium]|nr:ribosome biogenesis GTPase YlqF [Gammaproteobacteria bacterium]